MSSGYENYLERQHFYYMSRPYYVHQDFIATGRYSGHLSFEFNISMNLINTTVISQNMSLFSNWGLTQHRCLKWLILLLMSLYERVIIRSGINLVINK